MTTELEKQFFDTFGIEPKLLFYDLTRLKEDTNQEIGGRCTANWQGETKEETIRRFSPKGWKVLKCEEVYCYPQITDKHYLELICTIYKAKNSLNSEIDIFELNVNELKKTVLTRLIWINNTYKNEKLKHQVQAIFKGE